MADAFRKLQIANKAAVAFQLVSSVFVCVVLLICVCVCVCVCVRVCVCMCVCVCVLCCQGFTVDQFVHSQLSIKFYYIDRNKNGKLITFPFLHNTRDLLSRFNVIMRYCCSTFALTRG